MGYIIGGVVTLIIMIFHLLSNFSMYRNKFGESGAWVITTLGCTVGPLAWPITLSILAIRLIIRVRGKDENFNGNSR